MINPMLDLHYGENLPAVGPNSLIVTFLACGDLSGYDADTTYELGEDYQPHEAIQQPINPPYKYAVELRKQNKLINFKSEEPEVIEVKLSKEEKDD